MGHRSVGPGRSPVFIITSFKTVPVGTSGSPWACTAVAPARQTTAVIAYRRLASHMARSFAAASVPASNRADIPWPEAQNDLTARLGEMGNASGRRSGVPGRPGTRPRTARASVTGDVDASDPECSP
jgi:hypothetical protein